MHETHSVQDYLSTNWLTHQEGQLSVDVLETEKELIVRSAIAGVRPEDLDITLSEDTLTVRGERHLEQEHQSHELVVQECHWGAFSRSIILPSPVDQEHVNATLKRGILTIRLKKVEMHKKIAVHEMA